MFNPGYTNSRNFTQLRSFFLQEDAAKAVALYQQAVAVDKGNGKAHYFLALGYLHGKGIKQDLPRAVYHLKQAIIEGQYLPAKDLLVHCFQWGLGVREDARMVIDLGNCSISAKEQFLELLKGINQPWSFSFSKDKSEAHIVSPYNTSILPGLDAKRLKNTRSESITATEKLKDKTSSGADTQNTSTWSSLTSRFLS